MANRLQDFLPIRVMSGGVEVICEINTSHMSKDYFLIEARGAHIDVQEGYGEIERGARPPMLQMKVCVVCMVEYMAYMNGKVGEFPTNR